MRSKRGRVLIAVLVVASIVALTVIMVSRGSAVTSQVAPTGYTATVAASGYLVKALPLNTPVSVSISETSGGSSGSATMVCCSDGAGWSWIALNGYGTTVTRAGPTAASGTLMMLATATGNRVLTYSAGAGQIRIVSSTTPTRVYIHY